jgi:hypothetical protein
MTYFPIKFNEQNILISFRIITEPKSKKSGEQC